MIKPSQKLKCNEDKLKITKDVPDKDIELTLELEMDDEVKDIITCPEKYGNTMLDVTVIKPKLNKLYEAQKKTMSGEEVKKFIAAMNAAKTGAGSPQAILEEECIKFPSSSSRNPDSKPKSPLEKFAPPSSRKNTGNRTDRTEDSTSEVEKDKVKHIFAAPKTFSDLNSMFECKNKHRRDENLKPDTPCSCKHCSIVGIVADSQKKPFANETSYDTSPRCSNLKKDCHEEYCKKKKTVNIREDNHTQCQYYFKHLSDKIRVLESRIAAQEEKSIAKDYFKKIITKVMNHITRVTTYASQIRMEIPGRAKSKKDSPRDKYDAYSQRYVVNHMNVEKEKQDEPGTSSGTFWKWGEDILKPGVDLKNKIISMMEETLNNLKRSKEKPKEEELKHLINEFSANLYKTVNEDRLNQKHRADIEFRDRYNSKMRNLARTVKKIPEEVSVTYVNSKILKWKETETTFKFESDKESVKNVYDQRGIQDVYKMEFMKTLKNTKEEDKAKLWHSIWDQAVKNRQNRNDKVTIQIPDRRDPKRRHVEIIYTLGDLEYLLLGKKSSCR